ncbi:MAG: AAA family ATPase [Candidatus Sedimenticola sp. (ex Thyasira tokunagai)]
MRILAIRGENLASLAGEFELALEQPPLAHAGLFVITGHTGAGKSTLLDALCLALFDRMPRLPTAHGVAIGRADEEETLRVKSNDVGSILRRGTGSGYAEVDFRGTDGVIYRSRWEVRRARNRAGGRLQPQTITLTDLASGQVIGERKGETLKAISERLGLTFDQFRRSVLLAQGDFAAFLKATANDRSSLLERITGTGLYTELSKAAFERASEETTRLRELEGRLEGVVPLAEEKRSALEADKQQLEEERKGQLSETKRLQGVFDWYRQSDALGIEVQSAESNLKQATVDWEAAAPRLEALRQVEQVQPLRGTFDACLRAESEWAEATNQLADSKASEAGGKIEKSQTEERLKLVTGKLLIAEEALKQAQPDLAKCRQLETRIEAQISTLEARRGEHQSAQKGHVTAGQSLGRQQQALEEQRRQKQQTDEWLASHQAYAALADEWGRWEAELERYTKLNGALQQTEKARLQLQERVTEGETALEQQCQAYLQAEAKLEQATATLKTLERQRGTYSLKSLQSERESLELQQDGVRQGSELIQGSTVARQRLQDARDDLERARQDSLHHQQQAEDATRQLEISGQVLDEVKRARDIAALAQGEHAESLRAMLKEGEHCPVCGSKEHPWTILESAFDQQLESLSRRLDELEEQRDGLIKQQATSCSQQQQADATAETLQKRIAGAETQELETVQAWQALAFSGKPEGALNDGAVRSAIETLAQTTDQQLKRVKGEEQKGMALQQEVDGERRQLEALQQTEREALNQRSGMEADLRRLQEQHGRLEERWVEQQQQLVTTKELLATPLEKIDRWEERLTTDPSTFTTLCQTEVDAWQRQHQSHNELTEQIRQTESELATAAVTCQHAEAELERRQAALMTEQTAMESMQQARGQLFAGESVTSVEKKLDGAVTEARQQQEEVQQQLNTLATKLAAAEEGVVHWQQAVKRRKEQQQMLEQELEQGLSRRELTRPQLQQLLSWEASWLTGEQQAIAALKDKLEHCRTLVGERQQRLTAHEQGRPQEAREKAIEAVEAINAQLETTRQQLVSTLAELKQDDDRRRSSSELQLQLQQQQQQWELWAGLSELIGSHDGKKFRTFAQSLTLDSLLGYTNAHLLDLARRYRLERVSGSDLELQVIDTDMGDEVRSVHSLSGGESFLVSLALALGLASLSSSTTQVESLFIDEGFGSLDQETLEIAIDSLDTLQSLGRKVGVISHVPMLVERIGVRVAVEKLGGGRSRVITVGNP